MIQQTTVCGNNEITPNAVNGKEGERRIVSFASRDVQNINDKIYSFVYVCIWSL
jgi:hypothetical protein